METKNAIRTRRARDRKRARGLRPIQIWVPDARAPGFAEELARQCQAESALVSSPQGRAEMAFWDAVATEAWASLD
jgi:Protein  of unknown function (DUF3018)